MLQHILQHIIFFALRIENSSFPKPLSKEEEECCFNKIKQGQNVGYWSNILIKHNLRLVAHIVKKYYSSLNDQDDLISIGTIGLIKAVRSYDFEKNIKFATYASRCIENEILMHFRQAKKNANSLYLNDIKNLFKNNNYISVSNTLADENDVLEMVDLRCKSYLLYSYIEKFLTNRERMVLIYRYGLYNKTPLTQQETANKLKISRSYVSRIEKKAIQKLCEEFKKKY